MNNTTKPSTRFYIKPTGATAVAATDKNNLENLQKGGNMGNKRFHFNKNALNALINWMALYYRFRDCRHFVLTIPQTEWDSVNLDEQKKEKYFQKKVKYFFETCRRFSLINDYAWVKERNKKGILHWHVIHWGWIDYKKCNQVWSNILTNYRPKDPPKHSNCFRTRKGYSKVKTFDFARYFAGYFQKSTKYHKTKQFFFTKAYMIPKDGLMKTNSLKVDKEEFEYVKLEKKLSEGDYHTTFAIDIEKYSNLLNQKCYKDANSSEQRRSNTYTNTP